MDFFQYECLLYMLILCICMKYYWNNSGRLCVWVPLFEGKRRFCCVYSQTFDSFYSLCQSFPEMVICLKFWIHTAFMGTILLCFISLPVNPGCACLLYPISFTQTEEVILYRPNKNRVNRSFHG